MHGARAMDLGPPNQLDGWQWHPETLINSWISVSIAIMANYFTVVVLVTVIRKGENEFKMFSNGKGSVAHIVKSICSCIRCSRFDSLLP